MRKLLLGLLACIFFFTACEKDLGNYDYNMPKQPVITGLDSVYTAVVGDSLIITPKVTLEGADLELQWRIGVPETLKDVLDTGTSMRVLFALQAVRYQARLTVYNKTNGMKYFYNFFIDGVTQFSEGAVVLSDEDGTAQLSFVKPDGTVQSRLYRAMQGKDLYPQPVSMLFMKNELTGDILGYWAISKSNGVMLDPSTLQPHDLYANTFKDNFFDPPLNMDVTYAKSIPQGVVVTIVDGKLYTGTTNTWDRLPVYGRFGYPADGDYNLAPSMIQNFSRETQSAYFVGFDVSRRQFLRLGIYGGSPAYFGTSYSVKSNEFDPKNVGMDLVHMEQINGESCYAFCKSSDGTIYELKFNVDFTKDFTFSPVYKRPFIKPEVIKSDNVWCTSNNGFIFIGSGDKLYRYNPVNEEFLTIPVDFSGKKVSMIKVSSDQQTLIAGAEGSIYYITITHGINLGTNDIKVINSIPGSPIDIAVRQ